jgi:hypothetical protein
MSAAPDTYTYALGQDEIEATPLVTIGQFRTLARQLGWSEDWLVEQCRGEMDNPREIIREILSGYGMTKPAFTGYDQPARRVSLKDTALV